MPTARAKAVGRGRRECCPSQIDDEKRCRDVLLRVERGGRAEFVVVARARARRAHASRSERPRRPRSGGRHHWLQAQLP